MRIIVDWKQLTDVLIWLNWPICVLNLVVLLLGQPYGLQLMVISYAVMAALSIGAIGLSFWAALREVTHPEKFPQRRSV